MGRDTYIGGAGRDTFVLGLESGVDVIRDYQNRDKIGLVNGVTFDLLTVVQQGTSTVIKSGADRLAVLRGVQSGQIGSEDFVAIDFTTFKGNEIPVVI